MEKQEADLVQAIRYLKLTLPEMSRRQIPTTPENYTVWYEYVTGNNTELCQFISELDKRETLYTVETNNEIYQKFIASKLEKSQINQIKYSVRKLIEELLINLDDQGSELLEYSRTLHTVSEKIETVDNSEGLQEIVKELILETKKQEESTLSLRASLNNMANDMQMLRSDINRISEEVNTDDLTKIGNRRSFDKYLQQTLKSCSENNQPLALILLDIDHFKQFNDQFGHIVGDKVLKFVASILTKTIRGNDRVARIGGEEFGVILPETSYEGAMSVADNIRLKISSQKLTDSKENISLGSVTLSAGVSIRQGNEPAEDLLRRADKCLYQSKNEGRNAVTGERELFETTEDVTWL